MTKTLAERCVLVDLQQEHGKELFPLLDEFARTHQLEAERSHPINPKYIRGPSNHPSAEVSYLFGYGEFGAQLALFRFDSANAELPADFDAFVNDQVAQMHKVSPCTPQQFPTVYR